MAKTSDAQIKASNKYAKENQESVLVKVNKKTEKDILDKVASQSSKAGYIKNLIRQDLSRKIYDGFIQKLKATFAVKKYSPDGNLSMLLGRLGTDNYYNRTEFYKNEILFTSAALTAILNALYPDTFKAPHIEDSGFGVWSAVWEDIRDCDEFNLAYIKWEYVGDSTVSFKAFTKKDDRQGTLSWNDETGFNVELRQQITEENVQMTKLEEILGYKIDENFSLENTINDLIINDKTDVIDKLIKENVLDFGTVNKYIRKCNDSISDSAKESIELALRMEMYDVLRKGLDNGCYKFSEIVNIANTKNIPFDVSRLATEREKKIRVDYGDVKGARMIALKSALMNRNWVYLASSLKAGEFTKEDFDLNSKLLGCELTESDWSILNSSYIENGDTVMQAYLKGLIAN